LKPKKPNRTEPKREKTESNREKTDPNRKTKPNWKNRAETGMFEPVSGFKKKFCLVFFL
jgi:hypothetical protein